MTPNGHLFGWCGPTDQHHAACRASYVGANGVTYTCTCPAHVPEVRA